MLPNSRRYGAVEMRRHVRSIAGTLGAGGPRGFVTEWTVAGDAAARTITLPLPQNRTEGALSYNCIVDWGDGSPASVVAAFNDVNRIHTYAGNGTYEVEITGVCEGFSFNNGGDKLKCSDIVTFGDTSVFDGFKYLEGGFYGCTNLASLGDIEGSIPASGTGLGVDGFNASFRDCNLIAVIPTNLFRNHTAITTDGFNSTFQGCASITAIPCCLFRHNTAVSASAFRSTFNGCTSLTAIESGTFDFNTAVTTSGFRETFFGCTSLTTIGTDLFRYNTAVSASAFRDIFRGCTSLITVPNDTFRYNTAVSTSAFYGAFRGCSSLETVPTDFFRYNTAADANGFRTTFRDCIKLQLNKNIFYADGEQATRFLNRTSNFQECFERAVFTGVQGTAPDLWECDFGEVITIDVTPVLAWIAGNIITGQTSGATAEVVSQVDATHYKIKKHVGTYILGEIIGVTGSPPRLADQGAAHPTFAGGPTMTDCWEGAGNDGASLTNYAAIPADWI